MKKAVFRQNKNQISIGATQHSMKFIQDLPVLIIVIPLIFAVIIPLVARLNRLLPWIIATTISISLLITVQDTGKISYWLGGWEPPWGIEYVVDYMSAFVLVVVSFLAFIVSFYSRRSVEMEINEDKRPAFYSIYMLFVTGLMGIVITGDIFNIYVFLEISSLAGYALVAIGRKREALVASYNYLILGTIAATFIVIGIGYLYMATGTLNIADLRERLPEIYHSKMVLTAFAFFTVGFSLKIALFPLHTWLPSAYRYAPSVVSSIMAATATKVGAYIMLRIMFGVFKVEFELQMPVTQIFIVISSVAIILTSVYAIAQTDLKRILAYSSVGQIGYIVLGASMNNHTAMTGGIVHILNHALTKGSLFMVVGCIVYKTGIEDISGLRGLGKKMPFTAALFTLGGISMMGFPLTVGFISKWYISIGILKAGMGYLVPVIIVSSLLTAVYFWRVIVSIYFSEESPEHGLQYTDGGAEITNHKSQYSEAPWTMLAPAMVLAGLGIFFGTYATTPLSIAKKAALMLLH